MVVSRFLVSWLDKSFPSRGHKNVYARTCVVFLPVNMSFGYGVDRGTRRKRWKNVGYGWKGELIGARDTDPWTRLVLSLFWRTRSFLGITYIYIYIKKKNIVSHGCFEGRSCSSLGPKDGQRLWGREKLRFVGSKVCEEIIFDYGANTRYPIFFFSNRCMEFLGEGKRKAIDIYGSWRGTFRLWNVGLSLR